MQVRLYPRLIPGFVVAAGKFPSAQACHLGMFGCRIDRTAESGSGGRKIGLSGLGSYYFLVGKTLRGMLAYVGVDVRLVLVSVWMHYGEDGDG